MLTFYGHPLSPFARMAHMTLELLGIEYEFKKIDLAKGEQKEEWYLAINPKVVKILNSNVELNHLKRAPCQPSKRATFASPNHM